MTFVRCEVIDRSTGLVIGRDVLTSSAYPRAIVSTKWSGAINLRVSTMVRMPSIGVTILLLAGVTSLMAIVISLFQMDDMYS